MRRLEYHEDAAQRIDGLVRHLAKKVGTDYQTIVSLALMPSIGILKECGVPIDLEITLYLNKELAALHFIEKTLDALNREVR